MLAALSSIQTWAQASDNTESIHGTVINQVTRAPIARALVVSSDQRLATLTDSEGHFEFSLPRTSSDAAGPDNSANHATSFFARKQGFLTENTSRGPSPTTGPGNEITLYLAPEAVITGKVSLPNFETPDNITVELFRRQVQEGRGHWLRAGVTQSRSDGEFRFADLAAGTYKALTREALDRDPASFDPQGQLYGYPPVYSQNAPDFDSASALQISPGMTGVANFSVVRKRYYRVHIPVANVQPDTGLNVNVSVAGHKGPGFSLGYNNRDQAIEGMLPDGSYTVEAYGFGNRPGSGTGTVAITVNGGAVRGPTMTLAPNGLVRVDVTEQFASTEDSSTISFNIGQRNIKLKGPRRYLNVTLEPADDTDRGGGASLRYPTGPGDEALVIENARPGQYWVRINTSRGYAASIRSGSVDLKHETLVIAAGASPSPIEITMRDDTVEIGGTVEGITAAATPIHGVPEGINRLVSLARMEAMPPAPAYVYCVPLPDSRGEYAQLSVAPDGRFISPPLAPGAYRVLAFDRPQLELEYRNPEAMRAYEGKGPVVRLAGGQKESMRLQLISSNE